MIPVGYLRKIITGRPAWLDVPDAPSVIAVSECVMKSVLDVFELDGFNGWYFFDSPASFDPTLRELGADFQATYLLYFEVFEEAYDDEAHAWEPVPIPSEPVNVELPTSSTLVGYDVCSFSMRSSPECSGLSCNALSTKVQTNSHCLFDTLEEAKAALSQRIFDGSEPGPFRIFAIFIVDDQNVTKKS